MRWKTAGVLMCALSLLGCSNDVEKPTATAGRRVEIDAPKGKILILNPVQNLDEQWVTADVDHDGTRCSFRVAAITSSAGLTGGVVELRDESGALLFSFESTTDQATGETVLTQRTPDDYLVHRMIADDERVREQYDANGDVATFEYPALSEENQRHAANYYEHGLPAGKLPAPVAEFVGELAAFDTYYEPHSKSTLHDNPAGELLVQILASPETRHLVDGPDAERWQWVDNICHAARACQSLMCWSRPDGLACMVCTAISIGCTIMDLICSYLGC